MCNSITKKDVDYFLVSLCIRFLILLAVILWLL